jgi:hypothetical protein
MSEKLPSQEMPVPSKRTRKPHARVVLNKVTVHSEVYLTHLRKKQKRSQTKNLSASVDQDSVTTYKSKSVTWEMGAGLTVTLLQKFKRASIDHQR